MAFISVEELKHIVANINSYDFTSEFKQLPPRYIKSSNIGVRNTNKNRYEAIRPYDDNLVRLKSSNYINASNIMGYPDIKKKFIACQAPIEATFGDHWQMVLEYQVPVMVMLTPVMKDKSEQYWPAAEGATLTYGDVMVTLIKEKTFRDYIYRKLGIASINDEKIIHYVKHLLFLSWEDKGVPENTFPLLAFMTKAAKLLGNTKSPILIHCSAGVGRTGTFLTIWNSVDEYRTEKKVNVFETVKKLRLQRMGVVETEEQYKFVHRCILDTILHKDSGFDINQLSQLSPHNKKSNTERMDQNFYLKDGYLLSEFQSKNTTEISSEKLIEKKIKD